MSPTDLRAADVERALAEHELVGKEAPALPDHHCQMVTFAGEECGCQRLIIGCRGCDWTTEAAMDPWTNLLAHRQHLAAAITAALQQAPQRAEDGLSEDERESLMRTMSGGFPSMAAVEAILAARLAAERDTGLAGRVAALAEHWSGCWCTQTDDYGNQRQERDCPSHGSDDCVHMAEGIVASLRALVEPPIQADGPSW